jgi:integrase
MVEKTKRNAKGMGSIRQRADGTYEGRITINSVRKSFYADKQGEVVKQIRAAKKAAEDGVYFEPKRMTLNTWLDNWLEEYVASSVKPLTYATYKMQCNNHIKPSLGRIKLSSLNATSIQKLYNDLKRIKGLSPKTIKNTHGVLHKALVKAVQLRYIGFNPSDACVLPRIEKKKIKPFEEDEIGAFLKVIEDEEWVKEAFVAALFTGVRMGEVCGLSWDTVDFDSGTICITQQLSREKGPGGKFYIASTKNDRSRTITPAPFVMMTLREVKRTQNENKFKAGNAWGNSWDLVFTDNIGNHLIPQTVLKRFKKAASKIGRPDARFHDLRHTYAVTALQEGDNIKTVQENLGHATAAFTLDVYGHVSQKMKDESAARMESFIQSIKG